MLDLEYKKNKLKIQNDGSKIFIIDIFILGD